jgi:hypothetical protein
MLGLLLLLSPASPHPMVFIVKIPTRPRAGLAPTDSADMTPEPPALEDEGAAAATAPGSSTSPEPAARDSEAPPAKQESEDTTGLSLLASLAAMTLSTPQPVSPPPEPRPPSAPSTPKPAAPATQFPLPSMPAQASSSRELRPALDIYLAPAVQSHRFVRSRDVSLIVERPERIRALCLGVAGVLGRIEAASPGGEAKVKEEDELSAALQGLSVDAARAPIAVHLHTSAAPLSPPSPALVDIHSAPLPGSEEPYVEVLARLCAAAPSSPPPPAAHKPVQRSPARRGSESSDEEPQHASEVPAPLSQGDLYLCGPSADSGDRGTAGAIAASLGALGAALTRMYAKDEQRQPALLPQGNAAAARRAFVLARPPGHHCGPASPSGFCWVNNVAVAAAMAYREQMVDRVIILDVDLHHGSEYGSTREEAWSAGISRPGPALHPGEHVVWRGLFD